MGVVSQRHAVLRRRAAAHRRRRRHPDPAGRHAPRASRSPTCTATSSWTWTSSPTAATRCRSWASPARSPRPPDQQVRMPGDRASRRGAARPPPSAWRSTSGTRTCAPRFVGRWVSGVTVGPSPDAVQMRLLAAGQRPISQRRRRVELRDARARQADPHLRCGGGPPGRRRPGHHRRAARDSPGSGSRRWTTSTASSPADTLLIADPRRPARRRRRHGRRDLRGVATPPRDVVIESAIFDPVSIRRTAQRLALRSEASRRFEKGQEPRLARLGADRTAQLVRGVGRRRDRARASWTPRPCEPRPGARRLPPRARQPAPGDGAHRRTSSGTLLARVGVETEPAPPDERGHDRPQPRAAGRRGRARDRRSRRSCPPGAATSPSRRTSPRRSRASAATSWSRPSRPTRRCPRSVPSPLEVRELVRETLAGAGLTEVVTTALVSPRHIETFVLAREVPVDRRRGPAGRRPDRRRQPALARPLAAAPQPARAASWTWSGVNLRHGTEDVAVFEIGKGYARTGDEPREWWRLGFALDRRRGARGLEPRRAPVRPRRRQGHPGAARAPPRPRRARLRGRDRRGRVPPGPHRPGRDRRRAAARASSASCTRTSWRPGSCGRPARVIVGRGRDRRACRGAPGAGAAPAVGRLPRGGPGPRDRRARRRVLGRASRPSSASTPATCCATSACSTSTAACRWRATRRASRSGSGSGPRIADAHRARGGRGRRRPWSAAHRDRSGRRPHGPDERSHCGALGALLPFGGGFTRFRGCRRQEAGT